MSSIHLAFLNVGQGDTIVIFDPDTKEAIVVDCFETSAVLDFFKLYKINRLRALIITHPHVDHYLGAVDLLETCEKRGIVWDAFVFRWDKEYRKMPELLSDLDKHSDGSIDKKRRISIYQSLLAFAINPENKEKHKDWHELPQNSRVLQSIKFLHPVHRDIYELFQKGINNLSYVIKVSDQSDALLTGDLEPSGWEFLRKNNSKFLQNSILKFPHHGVWKNADVDKLLNEVDPKVVIISVGTGNIYDHPSIEVLKNLAKRKHIHIFCTQATALCSHSISNDTRLDIIGIMEKENSDFAELNKNSVGCLCAGTVVISLEDKVRVIWPIPEFHKREIVSKIMKTPRCCE